jgi:hypothetical protein
MKLKYSFSKNLNTGYKEVISNNGDYIMSHICKADWFFEDLEDLKNNKDFLVVESDELKKKNIDFVWIITEINES